MGVDERGDDQPGLGSIIVVELLDEALRLLGEPRIATLGVLGRRATVERRLAVWLGADPAREAEAVETVGREVERLRGGIWSARRVITDELVVGPGDQQVSVRAMPLALPEGAVAGGAEVVAECRHAVRIEPEHVGVEGLLG